MMSMKNVILFPANSDYKIFDRELKREYDAVSCLDLFDVYLYDDIIWNESKILKLSKEAKSTLNKVIYRGYMMKTDEYEKFYNDLKSKNIELITSPDEYKNMHIFPNSYDLIKDDTAKTLFFSFNEEIKIEIIRNSFDRFVIKDYVKSVKDTDFPKSISSNLTQSELDDYIAKFKKYRGGLLTGGICIKEFLKLKYYNDKINEFRVFYLNGNVKDNKEIISICRNSNQDTFTNEPPKVLLEKYRNLPSPYYTVDFIELDDGSFKIMEVGDGQVSGLSPGQDIESYYRMIFNCLKDIN